MEIQLKPCPFCGGEAEVGGYTSCDCCGKSYNAAAWCTVCRIGIDHRDTEEEAAEIWNKRVNDNGKTENS